MQKNLMNKLTFALVVMLLSGCTQNPVAWWNSINKKAEHIAKVESKYEALKKEHERLQAEFYHVEHEYEALRAEVNSKETANLSLALTGTKEGRAPASIHYDIPKGLEPKALLELGYEHLREKKFAEAAVTFESFISLPESASLPLTDVFYSAGVAWYQVKNFKKARENFETAKQHVEGEEREKMHKKVDLWMRAIDRKLASSDQRKE